MRTVSILKITASLLLGILLLGPAAGAAPVAAATPTATPTATPRPCTNAAQFVEDVTIPDNTILRGGASFVKTWRFKNTGTCTWSTGYKLMRDTGAALGGPASVTLPQAVVSNGAVDISVPLAAPYAPGIYKGYWQPADAGGRLFGPKVSVVIVVPNPALGEELPDTAIFWAGGGGGDRTVKGLCAVGYPDAKAPQVRVTPVESFGPGEQGTLVCIFGLPVDSTAQVTLVSPTGARYAARFDVGGPVLLSDFVPKVTPPVVAIPLSWPVNAVEGIWRLSVAGDGLKSDTNVKVSTAGREGMTLNISPLDSFNPFDSVDDEYGYTRSYPTGERVQFSGSGYPPAARVMLAIYHQDDMGDSSLAYGEMVTTDRAGDFETSFRIPDTLAAGRYLAVGRMPRSWEIQETESGTHARLEVEGIQYFFIRGGNEDPLPTFQVEDVKNDDGSLQVYLYGSNRGRPAVRGASLTLSSPDARLLEISETDVPLLPPTWSDCNVATPHAWVLTSITWCHSALQLDVTCRKMVNLTDPLAEVWYDSWATNAHHELSVRVQPRKDVSEVRIYARMSMLAGASGCRVVTAPASGAAGGTDQQGFPVQVITVPVSK